MRVAQSNIQVQISVIRHLTSARWHRWLADKKGIWLASHKSHTYRKFTKLVHNVLRYSANRQIDRQTKWKQFWLERRSDNNAMLCRCSQYRYDSDICDAEMLLRLLLLSVHLTSGQVDGSPTALLCDRMRCEHWCVTEWDVNIVAIIVLARQSCSVNECASEL